MIVVILILFIGVKYGRWDNFSLDWCNNFRGVACFYILLSHATRTIDYGLLAGWLWRAYSPAQILSNGIFFFISGYGLCYGMLHKDGYLTFGSFARRMKSFLIPAVLAYGVFAVGQALVNYKTLNGMGERVSAAGLLDGCGVVNWFYYDDVAWYIIELFLLYILFWILFQMKDWRMANTLLTLVILICTIPVFLAGRGLVWYASTLCFPLGIAVGHWHEGAEKICSDFHEDEKEDPGIQIGGRLLNYNVVMVSVLLISIMVFMVFRKLPEFSFGGYYIAANLSALFFCLFIFLLSGRIEIGNPVSKWLGKYFYEIYLYHMMILKMIYAFGVPNRIRIYIVLAITLVVAILMHHLAKWMSNRTLR